MEVRLAQTHGNPASAACMLGLQVCIILPDCLWSGSKFDFKVNSLHSFWGTSSENWG